MLWTPCATLDSAFRPFEGTPVAVAVVETPEAGHTLGAGWLASLLAVGQSLFQVVGFPVEKQLQIISGE